MENQKNYTLFFKNFFGREPHMPELGSFKKRFFRLNATEKEIIFLRFGLEEKKSQTLSQISEATGFDRERIRQIIAKALRKLRFGYPEDDVLPEVETFGDYEVVQDGEVIPFASFEAARDDFRRRIKEHLEEHHDAYYHGLPFEVGVHFDAHLHEGDAADDIILAQYRVSRLCSCLPLADAAYCGFRATQALNPGQAEFHYRRKDLYTDDELDARIIQGRHEIKLSITHGEDSFDSFLVTNAFVFEDDALPYYFRSHQDEFGTVRKDGKLESYQEDVSFELILRRENNA